MNILVFSWRGPGHPLAGGAEQVMHEHMKGWIDAGHTVTLFTSSFDNAKAEEQIDGVHLIRKGNQILTVHLAAFVWYVLGNHQQFDLVVDQFHGIPFFTPLYTRIPKLAVVQEVARQVWLKNDLHFPWNKIVGFIGFYGELFVYKLYKSVAFMTGSQSAKEELSKMGIPTRKITVV
ncbi:MAG: glycosyltransferase, partial [bacterium]|nr:glycosyltransferase [bacterium]